MTAASGRPTAPAAARLRPGDLAALASIGLRTRRLRAGLSALGIAIGVAAIVAVLSLARSSQATVQAEIQALGTNLLTVTSGQAFSGAPAELPQAAPGMIARLRWVTGVQDTGSAGDVIVRKSPYIPPLETNALSVYAATVNLPAVAGSSLAQGRFLNAATAREPVAVLGSGTARLLGTDRIRPGMRIWISGTAGTGGMWFYVTGAEAILLSLAGGAAGVTLGAVATAAYARGHGELVVIPPQAWAGGLAAAVTIGALTGVLPALRAARLSPTQALWTV